MRFFVLCVLCFPAGSWAQDIKPSPAVEKEVRGVLASAIKLLEAENYAGFVKLFSARHLARLGPSEKWVVKRLERDKAAGKLILTELKRLTKAQMFLLDQSRLAVFEKIEEQKLPEGVPIPSLAAMANVKLLEVGYGNDFKKAVAAAIADLKAKKYDTFISKMLPVAELRFQAAANTTAQLAAKFKSHPQIAKSMIDDLEAIGKLKPTKSKDGKSMTFTIKTVINRSRKLSVSREVAFQKTKTGWRFFDHSSDQRSRLISQAARTSGPFGTRMPLGFQKTESGWKLTDQVSDSSHEDPVEPEEKEAFPEPIRDEKR